MTDMRRTAADALQYPWSLVELAWKVSSPSALKITDHIVYPDLVEFGDMEVPRALQAPLMFRNNADQAVDQRDDVALLQWKISEHRSRIREIAFV